MTIATSDNTRNGAPQERSRATPQELKDYPVREYVACMAAELARMARWDGDEGLARALEGAADLASVAVPAR
jgi:hypothetical protein